MNDSSAASQPVADALPIHLAASDALVVVDVQNDFLPGGALAVPDGDRIVPMVNAYLRLFAERRLPIFATRDWHPANHCSFREQGGPWPPHCIANSFGAGFASALALPPDTVVISKGTEPRQEAYSGFQGTDLAQRLRAAGALRVFIGGLATEYCVLATASDALREGFSVLLLVDAIKALEAKPGDERRALQELADRGGRLIRREEVA